MAAGADAGVATAAAVCGAEAAAVAAAGAGSAASIFGAWAATTFGAAASGLAAAAAFSFSLPASAAWLAWLSLAISAFFSSSSFCMSPIFFSSCARRASASLIWRSRATLASALAPASACAPRSALLSFSSSRGPSVGAACSCTRAVTLPDCWRPLSGTTDLAAAALARRLR
ncbi:hypothetical protein D9M68_730400 [compost metagenome]